MDSIEAVAVLGALAQPTRLEAFRLLVRHEPEGLPAGEAARGLGVPQNTLSAHLAILAQAGLVRSQREGRQVIYRAALGRLRELTVFLLQDCCGGRRELAEPLIAELSALTCSNPSSSSCP
jgi:DNA-binding transcriptional ArsR family regulator